jgi:hypothetical protein
VYEITTTLNLQELHLEKEKDNWVALITFATYFPQGGKPNGTNESIKITLTEPRLRETLAKGYTIQRTMILGNRKGDMRLAIQDRVTGATGSVKLPLVGEDQSNPKNGQ